VLAIDEMVEHLTIFDLSVRTMSIAPSLSDKLTMQLRRQKDIASFRKSAAARTAIRQLRCLLRRFDCFRVERTSSRAGVAPAEAQRPSRRAVTPARSRYRPGS
jgi:hypothetical protein